MDPDGYTLVIWPIPEIITPAIDAHEDRCVWWLNTLRRTNGLSAWYYVENSNSKVLFRDPEDALAFKLMIAGNNT